MRKRRRWGRTDQAKKAERRTGGNVLRGAQSISENKRLRKRTYRGERNHRDESSLKGVGAKQTYGRGQYSLQARTDQEGGERLGKDREHAIFLLCQL